jgi:hypothetical protein
MRPAARVVQVARAAVNAPTVVMAVTWIDHFMMDLLKQAKEARGMLA